VAAPLDLFSPIARSWFAQAFEEPTEVQLRGWPEISAGRHCLLSAPTGSGKTLAAFFWCLDRLIAEPAPNMRARCRVLYVSPLKALAFDVDRNLRGPLAGLSMEAVRLGGRIPDISVGLRTGDTPAPERREMARRPPDILITTPESLFLLLTSAARVLLDSVRWVIVDEIHTMAATKRGAHLAISLERLCERTASEPQRIGLSATQRPLEEVGRYLGGRGRDVAIVDAGRRSMIDLSIQVPVEDMVDLDHATTGGSASGLGPTRIIGITTEIAGSRPWAAGDGDTSASTARMATQEAAPVPRRSIWPALYPLVLELVRTHRSTIIFVNSRRMAERMAAKLNELAEEELVRAHHGSIAREQREVIENLLKGGQLPALVATSSLELGIDMGAVDLVVQIGSPATVARGLQRVGRAGHSVGETSVGVILPTHRGDLLECTALTERMLRGDIESTTVPQNPLDILAQQIVAMCAMDTWPVEQLATVVRRAYPFMNLGQRSLDATLDMLDGRYPSEEFAELRPRIVWDRMAGTVRGRSGAQRLAVVSGGTIPDRGLFTVNLLDDGRRVGELDEEMVYELRVGETFVLGATTWKTAEITQSQVRVVPAPGEPGKITFWHGDALGRPIEVGRAVGALTRELLAAGAPEAIDRLEHGAKCDERAASNLMAYLEDQVQVTGVAPDDRNIVVERFRDALGDWRVCVLSPFGSRVHGPWAVAVEARLRERTGLDVQSISSDDGFALRLVDAEQAPALEDIVLEPEDVREAVTANLHGSALFASRFRENAARALLLPRLRPGARTPLWLQRQRSADLLRVASTHPDFPILVETYRECLTDVFEIDALEQLMTDIRMRNIRLVEVETASPSPFASSLVFDYIAQYMYEGDAPLAERRAQALTLDRDLLNELLGSEDVRDLLDADAISLTELELQSLVPERFPRDADESLDVLRHLGDLNEAEASARGITRAWLDELHDARRVIPLRLAGEERWIAADDAGLYRDALGTALPTGVPSDFLTQVDDPLAVLLRRWARTHAPFPAQEPARRWRLPLAPVVEALDRDVRSSRLLAGQFQAASRAREYAWPDVLRTIRRRSLAALRREVEPVSPAVLAAFEPAWHGIGTGSSGIDALSDAVARLQGLPLPVSALERDILPARVADYTAQLLDNLAASGEVVWIGCGSIGRGGSVRVGRVALYRRSDVRRLAPDRIAPHAPSPEAQPVQTRLRERLARGPCFFADLLAASGWKDSEQVLDELWEMVWAGEVTNDSFLPLRYIGPSRRASRRGVLRSGPPRSLGRWSLVSDLLTDAPPPTERLYAGVELLLSRYGIVTREHALAEGLAGGFTAIYPVLRAMEEAGRARRGYFVESLGGAQFALPGAVDRLRALRQADDAICLLASTDPANAYGVTSPWPEDIAGRPARTAGSYVVLEGGELRLFIERGGRSLFSRGAIDLKHVSALHELAGRIGKLEVISVNGDPVARSELHGTLLEGGFSPTHRGLVLYRPGRR